MNWGSSATKNARALGLAICTAKPRTAKAPATRRDGAAARAGDARPKSMPAPSQTRYAPPSHLSTRNTSWEARRMAATPSADSAK